MGLPSAHSFQTFTRNTVFLFSSQVVFKIIGVVSGLLLANYLDVMEFGGLNFALAFSALFIPLCDLGIDTYVVRHLAVSPDDRPSIVGTALASKALFSVAAFGIIVAAITVLSDDPVNVCLVSLGAAITVVRTFPATLLAFFRGAQTMEHEARSIVTGKLVEILGLIVAIVSGATLVHVMLVLLATSTIQALYTLYLARRHSFLSGAHVDRTILSRLLRGGILFALTGISVNIYFTIDTVMLSFMIGETAVGLYRSAYNLVFSLTGLSSAIVLALFPLIAQSHAQSPAVSVKAASNGVFYSLMLSLPIAVGGTILAGPLMGTLYKSSYAEAALTLQILVWWLPVMYVTNAFGHILGAINLQKIVLSISTLNACTNVILNLLLIPVWADKGAAIATVVTELQGLLLLSFFLYRRFGRVFSPARFFRLLLACVSLTPLLFVRDEITVLLLIPIGMVLYCFSLFFLRLVASNELQTLRTLLFRSGNP